MQKSKSLEDFYLSRYGWIPENVKEGSAHFNVFSLEPYIGERATPLAYARRDWFNITLVFGKGIFNYAEDTYNVEKSAIIFNDPFTPFNWERRDLITGGYYCLFNQPFFQNHTNLAEYKLFQPGTVPFYELEDDQAKNADILFNRMLDEIQTDYPYKYDLLYTIVMELIHLTMKLPSFNHNEIQQGSTSERITLKFIHHLERQFPIESPNQKLKYRSASDFANLLNIHVNHLNRVVKEITQRTTTQIIHARLLQGAKVLLKHTNWTVSEIAFSLGFSEVSHFNNFFRKNAKTTPSKFRSS